MLDLQRDVKRLYPRMEPPRLCIFTQEPKTEDMHEVTVNVRPIEDLKIYIPPQKKSPFAPSTRKGWVRTPIAEMEARRKQVLEIYNNVTHDTWKIAKMLKSTRGAIYNDLRAMGIK